ncbi:MAG: penicillin acylase family protein [Halobacteriales archaeon]
MPPDKRRRAILGAILGAGVGGSAFSAPGLLDTFAPLSGDAWQTARQQVPDTVSSPHGDATVTYDDAGVPHVEADTEPAAYYAVGFAQAADRLFEMDLIRRLMDGRLSAALGETTVDSDVFHAKMDFRAAAEASRQALSGTRTETLLEAFAEGVRRYTETGPDPIETDLAGYDIGAWTILDSLLVGTQISWGLTGSFNALRRSVLRERLDAEDYERLYEQPFEHGAPIIRSETTGEIEGTGPRAETDASVDTAFLDWLSTFEPPPEWGSNHWAVSGEHTDTGSPMLAYDPHLSLMAPPVWYEQRITVGDVDVRGATFPGLPFVIVGENSHGAWGFTNTGADVIDHYEYEYEIDGDRDRYRYDGEWRQFDTKDRTIEVADGEDRDIKVRKTVHGAFLDRDIADETRHVGVAWTGTSDTRESEAIYELSQSTGMDEARAALRKMDVPTQNALYVDSENVLYEVTGRIPIRRIDGEVVRGDRVFDGSDPEATWGGFEPYGESSWDGFVPFEDTPGVVNPSYIGTANQRPVDDPTYPIGQAYASGFRGSRIYDRLDYRIDTPDPVDVEFMKSVQRDTLDLRAGMLVPAILDVADRLSAAADTWIEALSEWDLRMDRSSAAALVFSRFYEQFRKITWSDGDTNLGFDEEFWPQEWVLVDLPPDDPFFDGDRANVLVEAMERAVDEVESQEWTEYGDVNRTTIDHQFGEQVPALNYPRYPTDGTGYTVFNVREGADSGSSWRQVSVMGGTSLSVLPGGQEGSYFSEHYDDQLKRWADGEYKQMRFETPAEGDVITFRGGGE